jgi:hypothetical protein
MLTYPVDRFDTVSLLTTTVPDFWLSIYDGRSLIEDLLRACVVIDRQVDQRADELYASISRTECPVTNFWRWFPVVLAESEMVIGRYLDFGDGALYGPQPGDGTTYAYGARTGHAVAFPLPTGLLNASLLTNALTNPTIALTIGSGFEVDVANGILVMIGNPFEDPQFTSYEEDGQRFIRMFLGDAEFDPRYIQRVWGAVSGGEGPSTANYKQLVNATLDASVQGSTYHDVLNALVAITDIPLAVGGETVEIITADADGTIIITDLNVYRFDSSSLVSVSVGDVLVAGQSMTDGLIVSRLNGRLPSDVTEVTLDSGFLWDGIAGDLTFANSEQSITVTTNVSGFTKITFPLTGASADVTAFFTEMHARGVAAGKTLANWLDIRETPVGQPSAFNLPITINPATMLVENAIRNNLISARINESRLGPNNLGLAALSWLRHIISPHTGLLTTVTS